MPRRFSSSTPYHWRWLHCTACRCAGSFTSRIPALPWRSSRLGRRRSPTGSRGSRLETTAFDSLARAVAVKEVAAMRLATQVRRLGGVRSVPPDANAFKRFLHWCACMWDSGKLMAESGSGRTFRRAMLACSCVDWVLLLGAWTAMGIQGAATHGGTWVNPGAAAAVPLAMFLALDAIRLSCQLAHSKLLRRLRSRRLGGTSRGSSTRSFIRPPAGMTTGLTRWVFFRQHRVFHIRSGARM